MSRYNFQDIEKKWQKYWEDNKSFKTVINKKKRNFIALEMFPYPSGKIHMGHVRNYTIGDVLARYKGLLVLMSYILWDGTLWHASRKCC